MRKFKDFGITPSSKGMVGEKIKVDRILNKEITVIDYLIKDSKYKDKQKCLHLQIKFEGVNRVLFSGSFTLQEMIQKVSKDEFPFDTIIIKENDRLEFS